MTQEQIIQGLKEVLDPITKNKKALNELNPETNIKTDLGLDSIGLIYAVMQFETKFNIKLPDTQPNSFTKVKDFIDFVMAQNK